MREHLQFAGNTVHIMIVHKGIQLQPSVYSPFASNSRRIVCAISKIIVIVVTGIQAFVKLIVCNAVQHVLTAADVARVIAVNPPHP